MGAPDIKDKKFYLIELSNGHRWLVDDETVLGRAAGGLRIANPSVSSKHCRLFIKNGDLVVQDLKSTNGTSVDGQPLTPHKKYRLKVGHKLKVGDVELLVSEEAPRPMPTEPPSPHKIRGLKSPANKQAEATPSRQILKPKGGVSRAKQWPRSKPKPPPGHKLHLIARMENLNEHFYIFSLLLTGVFGAMVMLGFGLFHNSSTVLAHWGALSPSSLGNGEEWRILTSTLIHDNLFQLAANVFLICSLGPWCAARLSSYGSFVLLIGSALIGGSFGLALAPAGVFFSTSAAMGAGLLGFGLERLLFQGGFSRVPHSALVIASSLIFVIAQFLFTSSGVRFEILLGGGLGGFLIANAFKMNRNDVDQKSLHGVTIIILTVILLTVKLMPRRTLVDRDDLANYISGLHQAHSIYIQNLRRVDTEKITGVQAASFISGDFLPFLKQLETQLSHEAPADKDGHEIKKILLEVIGASFHNASAIEKYLKTRDQQHLARAEEWNARVAEKVVLLNQYYSIDARPSVER